MPLQGPGLKTAAPLSPLCSFRPCFAPSRDPELTASLVASRVCGLGRAVPAPWDTGVRTVTRGRMFPWPLPSLGPPVSWAPCARGRVGPSGGRRAWSAAVLRGSPETGLGLRSLPGVAGRDVFCLNSGRRWRGAQRRGVWEEGAAAPAPAPAPAPGRPRFGGKPAYGTHLGNSFCINRFFQVRHIPGLTVKDEMALSLSCYVFMDLN